MCHKLANNHPILFPYSLLLDDFSSPIIFELVSLLFVACLLAIPTPTSVQFFFTSRMTHWQHLYKESHTTPYEMIELSTRDHDVLLHQSGHS